MNPWCGQILLGVPGEVAKVGVMALGRVHLSVTDARDLAEGALRGIGFDHDEARIVANHVIDAALIRASPRSSTSWTANTSSCRADP